METIGYVLSDLLELHSTATKKKKTTWQKMVFVSSVLLLIAFVSYESYALWRSYHRPIWIPSVEHHESLSYPEVLLCVSSKHFCFALAFIKKRTDIDRPCADVLLKGA